MSNSFRIPTMTKRIKLTNLVPAMDELSFEVRSSSGSCEMSTAHSKYNGVALCNMGVSGYNEMYSMTTMKFKLIPSHIYYSCVEVYQEEKLGTIDFFWPSGSPSMFGGKSTGDAGTWKKWDNVITRSTFSEGEYPIRLDFNNGGAVGKAWFDGVMLIDLTEAFGAGNEPTYAWCTSNIVYFTGTAAIDIPVSSPIQALVKEVNISKVPAGYVQLDYIESSGAQYIDTGIGGNNDNLTISVKFNMLAFTQYRGVFGNFVNESSNCVRMILTNNDNGRYYVYNNTAAGTGSTTLSNLQKNTINEVVLTKENAVVNGVDKAITNTAKGTDNNNNILIFTQNGKSNQGSTMRLYSFKIADNNVLVRDYIPSKRVVDGVLGLYDLIGDTFYSNNGSGEFIAGATVGGTVMQIADASGIVIWSRDLA